MTIRSLRWATALSVVAVGMPGVRALDAQAYHYPTFQTSQISVRDFNFAVAGDGDYGTMGLAQWREGIGKSTNLNFDGGLSSKDGTTLFFVGGGVVQSLVHATKDTPIDILGTGGVYFTFGNGTLFRLPLGVVIGHTFPLTQTMAVTPYASPRLSIDHGTSQWGNALNVNFDLGAELEVTRTIGLRLGFTFGAVADGPNSAGFGFSIAFRPGGAVNAAPPPAPAPKPPAPPPAPNAPPP